MDDPHFNKAWICRICNSHFAPDGKGHGAIGRHVATEHIGIPITDAIVGLVDANTGEVLVRGWGPQTLKKARRDGIITDKPDTPSERPKPKKAAKDEARVPVMPMLADPGEQEEDAKPAALSKSRASRKKTVNPPRKPAAERVGTPQKLKVPPPNEDLMFEEDDEALEREEIAAFRARAAEELADDAEAIPKVTKDMTPKEKRMVRAAATIENLKGRTVMQGLDIPRHVELIFVEATGTWPDLYPNSKEGFSAFLLDFVTAAAVFIRMPIGLITARETAARWVDVLHKEADVG